MIVNVCCSGSSGSTFFSQLLNRHPDIACGEELSLFSKPVFYEDYDHLKRWNWLIRNFGISSNPYFQDRAILVNTGSYGLRKRDVWMQVTESNDITGFVGGLEKHVLEITSKQIWAEKTPTNIFAVGRFLEVFPDSKVIHLVRDPRDVVLSFMGRGRTVLSGADFWLACVSAIQNYRQDERVLEIRYEDLILKSEEVLEKVCRHLNVRFDMTYFLENKHQSKGIERSEGLQIWRARPSGSFSAAAIGRYKESKVILDDIFTVTLSGEFASLLKVRPLSLAEVAEDYGYSFGGPLKANCQGRPCLRLDRRGPLSKIADVLIEKHAPIIRSVF
jgi:hypothetical protein